MLRSSAWHGPRHVVIVDDDRAVRETLRECFEGEGFRVSEADRAQALSDILDRERVDLILLDLRLQDEDGLDVARDMLARSEVPIIMVTGRDDPMDRIIGLEIGADDYIAKPFHVREVLARSRSVLRRYRLHPPEDTHPAEDAIWNFEGFTLDTTRRQLVSPEGNRSVLTTSEFELLLILLRHANQPLSRDRIMDLVKGKEWMANDRVIDNRILRLRRKLSSLDGGHDLIQSVRGYGYVLAAEVQKS